MNVGKTLFAQVMEFVPWKTFGRIIERHKGDAGVRTLGCADLFGGVRISVCEARETCPRRRASLATNDRRGGQVGAAYYAAVLVKRSA
jgi:hypothetical protein